MNTEETKNLCLSLLHSDTEDKIINILKDKGFWDAPNLWRFYGDKEDNFSTIGNQQSRPEAALVEKVVNSVDAVLMNECWLQGISPEDPSAPKNIFEAVSLYFGGNTKKGDLLGHIGYWTDKQRSEVDKYITLAATGSRTNPCFTISDLGEGQTPNLMPTTFLSLDKKNKLRIQFVQGKFNMGGTGVLQFCGRHNLQLIISRRNPAIIKYAPFDESSDLWGFTIIRRENPADGRKSSVYTYLAPVGANQAHGRGGILRFKSSNLPIFPNGQNTYGREAEWGTAIKLYEYVSTGFRTLMFMKDGLLHRLDLLLPEIALPIRLYECRDYKGHLGSFETRLSGLSIRLEDNKGENLEDGFPTTTPLMVNGEKMIARIYAFKTGRSETYRKNEGIIFTVNGQTHGYIQVSFFSRNNVGMSRLDDSILVSIDCSNISGRAREDLFLNSRDRLRDVDLRKDIEHELESIIRDHQGLRELREKRKREDVQSKLSDSKPLAKILESILKKSPSLSALFITGVRLSDPFKTQMVDSVEKDYKGKHNPTYFKFEKVQYGKKYTRECAINMRSRITFETDVVNDYFDRLENKGIFTLHILVKDNPTEVNTYNLNLHNGIATLNLRLPENCSVGDILEYETKVIDDTLIEPFVNRFILKVGPVQNTGVGSGERRKPADDKAGNKREIPAGLAIPEIHKVYKGEDECEWKKHKFDKFSALKIEQEEATDTETINTVNSITYSFYVNMDNIYLKTEMKSPKSDPEIIQARFVYGMVLVGMALIQEDNKLEKERTESEAEESSSNNSETTIKEKVFKTAAAIAPVLLPMIESLGGLKEEFETKTSGLKIDE